MHIVVYLCLFVWFSNTFLLQIKVCNVVILLIPGWFGLWLIALKGRLFKNPYGKNEWKNTSRTNTGSTSMICSNRWLQQNHIPSINNLGAHSRSLSLKVYQLLLKINFPMEKTNGVFTSGTDWCTLETLCGRETNALKEIDHKHCNVRGRCHMSVDWNF